MAQHALGAGAIRPRKRAFFGLLDADSWAWASLKAFAWLVIIILMLGYLPDRAYYFTVNRTVELGILAWAPVNLCPPDNEALPCPPPVGSLPAWHGSPPELSLPAPRTDGSVVQIGTNVLYIGGSDGTPQASVYVSTVVGTGNIGPWQDGPPLPAPRSDATVISASGSIYVIGGFGADGEPTTTLYVLSPDPQTGDLGAWESAPEDMILPEPRASAMGMAAADGLLLIGGEGSDGPVTTTWKAFLATDGTYEPWEAEAPLLRAQADGIGAIVGEHVWIWGGHDASGPVGAVQRGEISQEAEEGFPENPDEGKVVRWGISDEVNLPVARDEPAGWSANGVLYLVGGADAAGPQREMYWAIPSTEGELPEWKHLDASDLPVGLKGGSTVITGPNAIIVGGETADGPVPTSLRANTAPQSPFFQLGLLGAVVPGLKVEGEIGQQLGYLNAAGVGTVNFIILIIIGYAFAHMDKTRRFLARILPGGRRT